MRILLLIVLVAAIACNVHGKTVKKQLPAVENVLERPPLLVQGFKGFAVAQQLPKRRTGVESGIEVLRPVDEVDANETAEQQLQVDADEGADNTTFNSDNSAPVVDDFDLNNCFPRICHRMYLPVCASIDGALVTASSPCDFNNRVICARMARHVGKRAPTIRFLHRGPCA